MNVERRETDHGGPHIEAILAGAGLSWAAAAAPVVLARGMPWRVVWASPAAAEVLGTDDAATLTRILLTGVEPGSRQLARLADRMTPGPDAAVLRLRLRIGGKLDMITLSCRRLPGETAYFAMAPWGYRKGAPAAAAPLVEPPANHAPANDAPADAPQGPAPTAASSSILRLADRRGKVRFLWRTSRTGELTSLAGPLCETVGCDEARIVGRDFATTIAELNVDPGGALRDALSRKDTWSGIEVLWPVAETTKSVPIVLGGLPCFDRGRVFDGFSGFGVIHLDRMTDRPSQAPQADVRELATPSASTVTTAPAADSHDDAAQTRAPDEGADAALAAMLAPVNDLKPVEDLMPGEDLAPAQDETAEPVARVADQPVIAPPPPGDGDRILAATIDEQAPVDAFPKDAPASAPETTQTISTVESADVTSTGQAAAERASTASTSAGAASAHGGNVVPLRPWRGDNRAFLTPVDPSESHQQPLEKPTNNAATPNPGPIDGPPSAASPAGAASLETLVSLSQAERNAFREIARALGARQNEERLSPGTAATAKPTENPDDNAPAMTRATAPDAELNPAGQTTPPEEAPTSPQHSRELEAATRQASGDLSALVNRLDSGILVCRAGAPAYVNQTFLDILGYESLEELQTSGGVERMFRGRDPGALSREADGGAIPVIAANGDVLALKVRVQTVEWAGEPASLMTFRRTQGPEIAARLRALELDLRQRDAEARETHAILDTATDGVVVVDEDGRILSLNKSAQALFGYEQNEVVGEAFTILLARESHAPAMDYLSGLKSNGVKSLLNDGREVVGRASQGGAIPLFMTLGRVGATTPQRFCAVLRDMTQWKKVERELSDAKRDAERASQLKSDFLAKVSHEIRTPLNAILGFAEVIMDERFGPVGNERYKDYLKDIHSSGTHVLSLVNDLLDLSKIEAGKLDLNFSAVDANRIVNECVSLIQTQATRERVIIRLSLAPRLPNIVADERSLRQIVLNILSNAVKFNEPGGQVIVATALTDAGHAVIRIRDTGIGMTEKELETALEPFRQIATSRQVTGTGLGLPLTKALTEANRASFTIKSRKGEGTLVEIAFPQTRVLAE